MSGHQSLMSPPTEFGMYDWKQLTILEPKDRTAKTFLTFLNYGII
jgi:hypothetical protein